MAQLDQMFGHRPRSFLIADHDGVHKRPGMLIVYQYDRHHHLLEQRKIQGAHSRGGHDDSIHALLGKRLNYLLLPIGIGV